jgi:regulation of enolase protein 1 (concanavalin A-like superfamily)
VVCPNPACGASFEVKATTTTLSRSTHAPGARPVLLDRLPQSFMTSPPMIAVGAVMAVLYGVVLFAVVGDWKKKRLEAMANPPPEQVAVYVPPVVTPDKDHANSQPAPPAKNQRPPESQPGEAAKAAPPAPEKAATKATAPTPPQPPPPPSPPPPAVIERWGALSGSSGDCKFRIEGPMLTINIPDRLHLLNPEARLRNSPYMLTDVDGDFVATVKVTGQFRPGTAPLPDFPFPPFLGAGLLLWQDENNYLRLERTSIYSPEGKRLHQVMLEFCRDGKTLPGVFRDARDSDITLKFDRRGSEVRCSYTSDNGRNWPEIKRQMASFPNQLKVGVSASNAAPVRFAPRFEAWELTGPATRTAQGN